MPDDEAKKALYYGRRGKLALDMLQKIVIYITKPIIYNRVWRVADRRKNYA